MVDKKDNMTPTPVQKDMIKNSTPDAKVPSKDSRDGKLGGDTVPTTPAKAK